MGTIRAELITTCSKVKLHEMLFISLCYGPMVIFGTYHLYQDHHMHNENLDPISLGYGPYLTKDGPYRALMSSFIQAS